MTRKKLVETPGGKLIQWLPILISVATVLIGIFEFNSQQRANIELEYFKLKANDSTNFSNKQWEHKSEIYVQISQIVGNIISFQKDERIDTAQIKKFSKIYYGESILVEDSIVNVAMTHFKRSIDDYNRKWISEVQLKTVGMDVCGKIRDAIRERRN